MKTLYLLPSLLLFLAGPAMAQDNKSLPGSDLEPVAEEEIMPLVHVCEQCHGPGGQSARDDVPVIAGKPATEILAALEQFYYYERHCPSVDFENQEGQISRQSMCDITNMLNKQEVLALGGYFENSAGNGKN